MQGRRLSVQQDTAELMRRRTDLEDVLLEALELSMHDVLSQPTGHSFALNQLDKA